MTNIHKTIPGQHGASDTLRYGGKELGCGEEAGAGQLALYKVAIYNNLHKFKQNRDKKNISIPTYWESHPTSSAKAGSPQSLHKQVQAYPDSWTVSWCPAGGAGVLGCMAPVSGEPPDTSLVHFRSGT